MAYPRKLNTKYLFIKKINKKIRRRRRNRSAVLVKLKIMLLNTSLKTFSPQEVGNTLMSHKNHDFDRPAF